MRTPRIVSRVAKVLFALGTLAIVLGGNGQAWFAFVSTLSFPVAGVLFIVSYILSLSQTSFPGRLEVHADRIGIWREGGLTEIPTREIRSAMAVEREGFASVEIELRSGDMLVARVAEPSTARAVVDGLGFGAAGARVHAKLARPTRRLLHPLLGVGSLVVSVWGLVELGEWLASRTSDESLKLSAFLAYPAVSLALYAIGKRLLRTPEVTVGDDGVRLRLRLRSRFLARRDIALVEDAIGRSLCIETRAGERVRVAGLLLDGARLQAIARVIEERAGPSAAGADRFAHYERGGRPLEQWRAHLAHAMNEGTYRANAATVDEALAVLRSGQATPGQRVGAALALRVAGEPRERIRVAAFAAVDERMREALEAIAESDDDQVIDKAVRRLKNPHD